MPDFHHGLLAQVFDVDAFGYRTAGRNQAVWDELLRAQMGSTSVVASRMYSPWESRPWILFPKTTGTPVDWLVRYSFGGWENRWTLLGIAEAYARIATAREVRATILNQSGTTARETPQLPAPAMAALSEVRGALQRVGIDGTARGLSSAFGNVLPKGVVVLSKTGTLNEETDRFKALAIALGRPTAGSPNAPLSCGLIVVSYFEFAEETHGHSKNPLPPVHLEFARDRLAQVLSRHWSRLSGCAQADQPHQ